MVFYPGTHQFGYLEDAGEINPSRFWTPDWPTVSPSLDPGDLVVMNSMTWHGSGPHVSGPDRVLVDIIYQPADDPSGIALLRGNWRTEIFLDRRSAGIFTRSRVSRLIELQRELDELEVEGPPVTSHTATRKPQPAVAEQPRVTSAARNIVIFGVGGLARELWGWIRNAKDNAVRARVTAFVIDGQPVADRYDSIPVLSREKCTRPWTGAVFIGCLRPGRTSKTVCGIGCARLGSRSVHSRISDARGESFDRERDHRFSAVFTVVRRSPR